jgi:TatD DNase family protein
MNGPTSQKSENAFALVDSHAHMNLKPLSRKVPQVLERAKEAGVKAIINIGIDIETSKAARQLSENASDQDPILYFSAGIHPHDSEGLDGDALKALRGLLSGGRAVAVGEIGLDYYRDLAPRDVQKRAFEAQLELAHELGLPIIIHDREAHEDIMDILSAFLRHHHLRGVFHCFSGDEAMAKRVLDMGFFISFTGVITFPKAEGLRQVARYVPPDRMLVETDCPFLAPVPFRGKTNEPAYVAYVARALADVKGIGLEECARWTTRNAAELFGLGAL